MKRNWRRVMVGATVVVGITAVTLGIVRNREPARETALSVAETLHAEPMEDVLRYSPYTYSLQDWLLLSSEGSVRLWQSYFDRDGQLDRWLPRKEKDSVLRTLRDVWWGPPPEDADIERVVTAVLAAKGERRTLLAQRLLPMACMRYNHATAAQRARVEKRVRFLAFSKDPVERAIYAQSQRVSDTAGACLPVLRALLTDQNDRVRAQVIYALGYRQDASLKPLLPALFGHPSEEIRAAWEQVQYRYTSPSLVTLLWKETASSVPERRRRAFCALANQRQGFQRQHVPLLRRLLQSPDPALQKVAASKLMQLKETPALSAVRKLLYSPDPKLRHDILLLLWQENDRESLPRIRQLMQDPACGRTAEWILEEWDPAYRRKNGLSEGLKLLQRLSFQ